MSDTAEGVKHGTIEQVSNARCSGCAGCFNACPEDAITMILSGEGFYRPVLDVTRCKQCGLCVARCPELSWPSPSSSASATVFAAWSRDDEVRLASSSGGVFSELARATLEKGGLVTGCAWNENWEPEHVLVRSWDEVARLRGSKYIPSRMGTVIREISALAGTGQEVLYCGTPCQVAAVDIALPRETRQNVILADLICHGVPSLRAFGQYVGTILDEELSSYEFRAKTHGWPDCSVRARTISGDEYDIRWLRDIFQRGFQVHHLILMEACHDCRFQAGARPGDITLGDFWGLPAQWHDERGVSVVLANTRKGRERLDELASKGLVELRGSDLATAARSNPRLVSGHWKKPLLRAAFMRCLARGVPFTRLARVCLPALELNRTARHLLSRARRLLRG